VVAHFQVALGLLRAQAVRLTVRVRCSSSRCRLWALTGRWWRPFSVLRPSLCRPV